MHFDARTAKALRPGEHMVVDGCPGLRLVAAASWKSWTYRYKDTAGRMKQASLGRWPAMSAAEAVSRWQALRDAKAAGVDPGAAKRAAKAAARAQVVAEVTVRDVVTTYVRDALPATRSPSSLAAASRALNRLLDDEPDLAAATPKSLTRSTAFDVLSARADTPTATSKLRSLLGAAWDHALDSGRISEDTPNWWRQVLRGKLKSRGKVIGGEHQGQSHAVLSAEQCGEILRWAPGNLHAHGLDLLVMYLWTGARGAEILRIQAKHVALERDGVLWATLPKSLTKNAGVPLATDLRIPLLGRAREVVERRLAEVRAGAEVMWPDAAGQAYSQKAFSTAVYDLMPDSPKGRRRGTGWPITGWSPHRLRATVRTLLAGLGCPREVGEAILGHVPTAVEGTYNRHRYDAERVLWLGRLDQALEAAARPALP